MRAMSPPHVAILALGYGADVLHGFCCFQADCGGEDGPRRALDILICSGDDLQTRASHRGAVQDPARGGVMWMPGEAAETRADAARLAQKRLTAALDGATAVYRRLTPSSPEVQANYMARSTV